MLCGMLSVMYGSSVFVITERSEMGLYDVYMFASLFGFGIGMMFSNFDGFHGVCYVTFLCAVAV